MADSPSNRELAVSKAKIALRAELYDEMVEAMNEVAKMNGVLTAEERHLLSVGYMNVIGSKRASLRAIKKKEEEEKESVIKNEDESTQNFTVIKDYRKKLEREIARICDDVIKLINVNLIPSSSTWDALLFYNKMKGDYKRYLAEVKTGSAKKNVADEALEAYLAANHTAAVKLHSADPIRLGLALNLSTLYYVVLGLPKSACRVAKQAVDEAISGLDNIDNFNDDEYKDSTLILHLLKDNLTKWS